MSPPRGDQAEVDRRRAEWMARIDAMPPEWRALVHEHGLTIVDALQAAGVTKARQARNVILVILRESRPLEEGGSSQGHGWRK